MSRIESELYVPSVPRFPDDLCSRNLLLDPAREKGFKNTGLMLVVLRPQDIWEATEVQKQLDNLDPFLKKGDGERPVAFIMMPWKPLTGTADLSLNFLRRPSFSRDYVGKAIDFAARIPNELTPETGRAVSFHLSTYVTPDEWKSDPEYWKVEFGKVIGALKEVTKYGKEKGVNIHVENVPVVPWGDWAVADDSKMPGTDYHFRDLGTPWPGLTWRPEIQAVRRTGAKWTIDICHMHTAMRNVKEVARLARKDPELGRRAMDSYMVFESDLAEVHRAIRNFSGEILGVVKNGDIVHLNQTTGKYTRADLQGKDVAYGDSASITDKKGNIPEHHVETITEGLLKKKVKVVIEVNEPKGKMAEAPNTKASLDYVLKVAQGL
jgi:hypothetical protein